MSTVRIDSESHERLKRLAESQDSTLQTVLQRALKHYEDSLFFDQVNADFAHLNSNPEELASYEAEQKFWQATSAEAWPAEPS